MIKKIFLLFILVTVLAFLFNSCCFAQRELEIEYPELEVPGVETPTTTRTILTEFIKYIFTFAIVLAGLLAFGSLIYGGIRYLTSAGDPTKMSDGKNQAMAGFLGLIILLSSYLILNTINPQLVLKETPAIESLEKGIYAFVKISCVDDPDDFFDDPVSISQNSPDLSIVLPRDANGVPQSLQCIKFRSGEEELTVKVCSNTDFGEPCTPYEGDVGEIKNVTGQSIKLDYHLPGVYLYASNNCTSDDYKIYQANSATLPEFDNKTNSIKFIYDDKNPDTGEYGIKYAVILHEKENFMGRAAIFDQDQNICLNLSVVEGSASNLPNDPGKYYSSIPIGISSCEAATCFDDDGGQVWDTYGECKEDEVLKSWDTCIGDVLGEAYCDGSECKQSFYDCLAGGYDYCQDGACHAGPPSPDCDDTDGGKDYDTLGSCYEINGASVWIGTDGCKYGSNTILVEYYCDPTTKRCKTEEHNCSPNGCSAGICTTAPPTCEETDGGINYTQQGTCSDSEGSHTDYCEDSTFLLEYFCKGGYCSGFTQSCSPGNCQDGECSQAPNCMRPACELEEKASCMCGTTEIQNQYCCASLNKGYDEKDDCLSECSGAPPSLPAGHGYGANLSGTVSSITVYLKPVGEPIGQGVKFWGDKNYTKEKDDVETIYYGEDEMVATLESIDADDKITSMEMDGHYVALLFRDQNYQEDCEVFMTSCPDFRSYRIGQCGWLGRSDCLSSFIIKARK